VTKPTYEFIPSPNFTKGRRRPISAIVIHYTGSVNIEGPISWFQTKKSGVSSHYLVGRDGRVVQMVHDGDTAWHAGRSAMAPHATPPGEPNVNNFSIGIELVGTGDSGFTDAQMASFYSLIELLVSQYHIPPDRVVGHSFIAPGRKLDPEGFHAQFNWQKTRAVATAAAGPPTPPTTLA
jgi:N-acetylmuramoyl-L-alanine amidase